MKILCKLYIFCFVKTSGSSLQNKFVALSKGDDVKTSIIIRRYTCCKKGLERTRLKNQKVCHADTNAKRDKRDSNSRIRFRARFFVYLERVRCARCSFLPFFFCGPSADSVKAKQSKTVFLFDALHWLLALSFFFLRRRGGSN